MKQLGLFIVILVVVFACKKRGSDLETEGALTFSKKTVTFDTVFTGVGSATEFIKVYNTHNKPIEISSVALEGLAGKSYRFNIDGLVGTQRDLTIPPNDSLYLFVEVTVDANNQLNPFFIEDNLVFITNGVEQKVSLTAYGQNAYYYRPNRAVEGLPPFSNLSSYQARPLTSLDVTWKNDKPHVIYGYLLVDSLLNLKIEPGTQIHLHKGAGLWVYRGASLQVMGEKDNKVVFQGDRLEQSFDAIAGQWDRIWINTGAESTIKHAVIKNGYVGLQVEPLPFGTDQSVVPAKVNIQKTTIQNMVGIGVFIRNANVEMENSLVYNMGNYNVAVTGGGTLNFRHNTFANYWSGNNREEPMLFVGNRYTGANNSEEAYDLSAYFGNCIIYGSKDEELKLDSTLSKKYDLTFDHCVIRTEQNTTNADRYINCVINPANVEFNGSSFLPVYRNPGEEQFDLFQQSVAVDAGDLTITQQLKEAEDLQENARDSKPDIGAFEFK